MTTAEKQIQNAIENGNDIKEIHYSNYKQNYEYFETVLDSYNAETKTIKVILPNYDKKVEIIDKLYTSLKPAENETEKMEIYKSTLGGWFDLDKDTKIEAIKSLQSDETVSGADEMFSLKRFKSELITAAKKVGLI